MTTNANASETRLEAEERTTRRCDIVAASSVLAADTEAAGDAYDRDVRIGPDQGAS